MFSGYDSDTECMVADMECKHGYSQCSLDGNEGGGSEF
jgi:hypothetical protein